MSDSKAIQQEKINYRNYDRKTILTYFFVLLVCASLPGNVKCDMGDTISSIILFLLISVFICAGIGWWSRRGESKF
jgi:hypothetical protein